MLCAALLQLYGKECRKNLQLGNGDTSRGHRDYGICLATLFSSREAKEQLCLQQYAWRHNQKVLSMGRMIKCRYRARFISVLFSSRSTVASSASTRIRMYLEGICTAKSVTIISFSLRPEMIWRNCPGSFSKITAQMHIKHRFCYPEKGHAWVKITLKWKRGSFQIQFSPHFLFIN